MTSDDQFFFDYLASIPNDVRKYSVEVADSIDRHVDHVAGVVRETLSHQSWMPASIKPHSRSPPSLNPLSGSLIDRTQQWAARNRAWVAAILAFVGTGALLLYGSQKLNSKKRKARKAGNGARKEIVVIAGSPHEAMTRSIAADLERRGFIVFVAVTSDEEARAVKAEDRADIHPLYLDLTLAPSSPPDIHPSLRLIHSMITQPQVPMAGIQPHTCQLSGLIILPPPNYPAGPLATIPPSRLADTINTRLLSPLLTVQLFLPLLTLKNYSSSVVFMYPSISSSLAPPFASSEVAITQALSGFATSLRRELKLLQQQHGSAVDVVELKLGNVDLGPQLHGGYGQNTGTEVLAWNPQQRALYGSSYLANLDHRPSTPGMSLRGTAVRDLHLAVFDAITAPPRNMFGQRKRKKQVMYVGRGSRTYAMIGNWLPGGLVGWMLGLRSAYVGPQREIRWDGSASAGSSSSETWERL